MIDEKLRDNIKDMYNRGESIQAIARTERVTVPQVLDIIGRPDLGVIEFHGDLIDQTEAGNGAMINSNRVEPQNFSTD